MEKKDLAKTLLITVLTAIITSTISYFLWIRQFEATKNLALYEHKLNAIEKFSKDASTMIFYLRFMDKIHLRITQKEMELLRDNSSKDPFYDIKYTYKSKLTDAEINQIVKEVKQNDTSAYRIYEKANDFLNQMYSTYTATTNFFDGKTASKLKKLQDIFNPEHYQETVLRLMKTNNIHVDKVEDGNVDDLLLGERHYQLDIVIQSMKDEIKLQ